MSESALGRALNNVRPLVSIQEIAATKQTNK